jgi:hypothetical protein
MADTEERQKELLGGVRALRLGNSGKVALVDAADYVRLSRYRWHLMKGRNAYRHFTMGGRQHGQMLTHAVMGAPRGTLVRTINGDPLDCRRANLRAVSRDGTGTVYVNRRSRRSPYRLTFSVDGVQFDVGGYPRCEWAEEARAALSSVAAALRGRGLTRAQIRRAFDLTSGRKLSKEAA